MVNRSSRSITAQGALGSTYAPPSYKTRPVRDYPHQFNRKPIWIRTGLSPGESGSLESGVKRVLHRYEAVLLHCREHYLNRLSHDHPDPD